MLGIGGVYVPYQHSGLVKTARNSKLVAETLFFFTTFTSCRYSKVEVKFIL